MKVFLSIIFILSIVTATVFSNLNELEAKITQFVGDGGGEGDGLPEGNNSLFHGSGRCSGCHGYDPLGNAGTTPEGTDVNLVDDWRASMMANSAKDPFWRAKVSHEITVNPAHQEALEDKCLSCHASLGRFAAIHDGATSYSMDEMLEDELALDGVSCASCHQQRPENIGSEFSGNLYFDNDTIYGQFGGDDDPVGPIFAGPMESFIGYTPVFSEHISTSELCAGCHTLITESVDLEGEFTGSTFVEQATYHEWLNSIYNTEDNENECQSCHMPSVGEPIVLSANYSFLQPREPFSQHYMVGGNSFMLGIFKNNIDSLGLTATEEQFQRAIDRTLNQLQNQTLEMSLSLLNFDDDSARYEVELINQAGHKFPSGYPSRRVYIEFIAVGSDDDTIFHSGALQSDFEVFGQNDDYEPHYDVITNEEQVQIYEQVMGDVNNDVTTVLERAHHPIKDNRLVPIGFSMDHAAYDTIPIVGGVEEDLDFNESNDGGDRIGYHFPLNGYTGDMTITTRVFYQSDPPKWNDEMFALNTPEIDKYRELYLEAGAIPVLIEEAILETNGVSIDEKIANNNVSIQIFNTVTTTGIIQISTSKSQIIDLYNVNGQLLKTIMLHAGVNEVQIPNVKGMYFIFSKNKNEVHITKVVNV